MMERVPGHPQPWGPPKLSHGRAALLLRVHLCSNMQGHEDGLGACRLEWCTGSAT